MKKTAIILGATGLTGSILLQKLERDDRYGTIKLFSRSRIEGLSNKVEQHIGDVLQLEKFKDHFMADEVYCCIGTTTNKTPDKELYRKIDMGIPVTAAQLSRQNDIKKFLVISAMGADRDSRIFYNRTKGEMEQGVLKQEIRYTSILRPSLIDGDRDEQRTMEKIGIKIFKVLEPLFVGPLKKYKIIQAEEIAQAMINLANASSHAAVIITSNDIKQLAKKN
ncbi:NAD(P)H-binding protein [Maribacter sp. MAR_2009_72]|uniref:NAD(P)H-binding protein n=1 Tax=Maribacter sp. MAR_2009_72 TaxID=1250050 RepID=UPI00119C5462|nr:NAD(P)H-binding protein [Maribacter sp. MAR_2009_72]TVZ14315.1 uncharacterized protein YbjT (DUF2867 family) [Maribacter sp. MAR_2009_72]